MFPSNAKKPLAGPRQGRLWLRIVKIWLRSLGFNIERLDYAGTKFINETQKFCRIKIFQCKAQISKPEFNLFKTNDVYFITRKIGLVHSLNNDLFHLEKEGIITF